jgi:ABC-type uncharacterized transport system substrate-binding protein
MTNRRLFIALALVAPLGCSTTTPQTIKVWRIGTLSAAPPPPGLSSGPLTAGLSDMGLEEGRDFVYVRSYHDDKPERMAAAAAELVAQKADVIVVNSTATALAAKKATATIPIVMLAVGDPVANGLVSSLESPGGNVTGLTTVPPGLNALRLRLLREAVPGITNVALLWAPHHPGHAAVVEEVEQAARALGVATQRVMLRSGDDVAGAIRRLARQRHGGAFAVDQPLLYGPAVRDSLFPAIVKARVPCVTPDRAQAQAGALMSYGVDLDATNRRGAYYVQQVLGLGARPGDLAVEVPSQFQFVVNAKTAAAIGVRLPASITSRASEVIR